MHFIGDVHGKHRNYIDLIRSLNSNKTVQIGDFGVGFGDWHKNVTEGLDEACIASGGRFIRGNHDNPEACKAMKSWISDGTIENNVMYIGGALSIDAYARLQGWNWWEDEELSYDELFNLNDIYEEAKPRVMVTHECPEEVAVALFPFYRRDFDSRTRKAFQSMFELHRPGTWVFGHWHHDVDKVINGTRFICLNELSTIEFDEKTFEFGEIKPFT